MIQKTSAGGRVLVPNYLWPTPVNKSGKPFTLHIVGLPVEGGPYDRMFFNWFHVHGGNSEYTLFGLDNDTIHFFGGCLNKLEGFNVRGLTGGDFYNYILRPMGWSKIFYPPL
jgi:hypothetical protein